MSVKEISQLALTLLRSGIAGVGFWFIIHFSKYRRIRVESAERGFPQVAKENPYFSKGVYTHAG